MKTKQFLKSSVLSLWKGVLSVVGSCCTVMLITIIGAVIGGWTVFDAFSKYSNKERIFYSKASEKFYMLLANNRLQEFTLLMQSPDMHRQIKDAMNNAKKRYHTLDEYKNCLVDPPAVNNWQPYSQPNNKDQKLTDEQVKKQLAQWVAGNYYCDTN